MSLRPDPEAYNIVAVKNITLAEALWLARGKHGYDALAYDKQPASQIKPATAMAVRVDAEYDLPSIDRVLVDEHRDGADERPRDVRGLPVGKDERPIIKVYADSPNDIGGRLKLRGNKESLAVKGKAIRGEIISRDVGPASGNPPVGSNITIQGKHMRYMFTHGREGDPHPQLNRRAWLEANSRNNILLPTGAADICPKCGYTACHCRAQPHNPATCLCHYHVALRAKSDTGGYLPGAGPVTVAPSRFAKGYSPLLGRFIAPNVKKPANLPCQGS